MSQQTSQTEYPETRSNEVRREVHVDTERERSPRFELSVPRILAGALAAASAAVAASWLGVAGTVLGAVIVSVVVSVTTALYSHPLERSSQVIREVLPPLPNTYRGDTDLNETRVLGATTDDRFVGVDGDSDGGTTELPVRTADTPSRRAISWKAVAVSSVLTLVAGLGLLTAVEALTGGAVGPSGGGTTLSRIVKGNGAQSGGSDTDKPATPSHTSEDPDNPAPTTDEPTDSPATDEPTTPDPTEPEPTPTAPTPTQPTQGSSTGDADTGDSFDSGDEGSAEDLGTTPQRENSTL